MRLREDHFADRMEDEEFREAYYELEPDFEIAKALLQYRSDKNLTQAELAKLIKINRSDLSKLESADANPTLKTLKKIAQAIGANLQIVFEPHLTTNTKDPCNTNVICYSFGNTANDSKRKQPSFSVSLDKQHEADSDFHQRSYNGRALAKERGILMQASFELERYEVISCSYIRNEVEGEYQGSMRFEPLIQRSEDDSDKFRVEIKTKVTGLADIEVVVAGYFASTSLLDDDVIDEAILFSSLHLLIPFIRSYIHTISCQDGRPAVVLPVINVGDLLKESVNVDNDDGK